MKTLTNKLAIKIVLLLCLCSVVLMSQTFRPRRSHSYPFTVYELRKFDPSNIQQMLGIADSIQHDSHSRVCSYLAEKRLSQILPKVKEGLLYRIQKKDYSHVGNYLASLYLLKDNETLQYAKILVDSMLIQRKRDMYRGYEYDLLDYIDFTVAYGDPTYYADLITLLKENEPKFKYSSDLNVVRGYAIVFPEMKPQIFNDLKELATDTSSEYRQGVISVMGNFEDLPEQREFLYALATTDPLFEIRLMAIRKLNAVDVAPDSYLFDAMKNLVLESISQNDTDVFISTSYELDDVRSPYVLKMLKDLTLLVPDGYYRDHLSHLYEFYEPAKLLMDYGPMKGYGVAPASVLLDSLKNYTLQCSQLQFLGSSNFVKELTNHLDNAKKHLGKKDSLKCAQEVEKFQSKIDKEYKEASTRDNRFVTIEGWKFLYYNAQYIIERLVALPNKSQGTLIQQTDELKAELASQKEKKNIGGVLLVKSLTFLIDQAAKHLQKTIPSSEDSAKAALFIASFRLLVDEVWELTEAISGKQKKFTALYVYDEAYIQLHYRAKYILEALPAPRTLIDMKSVQLDDDVRKEFETLQRISKEQ